MAEVAYQNKMNADGTENPKYVDLLEEDKAISGQKFVCVSFVSPENILKRRELFMFEEFLKGYDFSKSMEKFSQFLNFLSYKYNLNFETLMSDMQEFVKSEKDDLKTTDIYDSYKTFLDNHENELDDEFNKQNNFQTSVRGLKVRGSYSTQEEAELRCKLLREVDPNHNVYVGPVGVWMPWEPEAYKTGRVEYLEDELNQLMHEKNTNEAKAKQEFEKRIQETKRKAIEENVKLAKESGNKLTQRLNKDGDLVGVNNTMEEDLKQLDDTSSESIKKALFEGDNIVRKKQN
jgi:flagellar biosynthesis/type III secretory pathway protein FliH